MFCLPNSKSEQPTNAAVWLSILFGGLSMLSKETGITVFLLNITYDLYKCWPMLKHKLTVYDIPYWPTAKSRQFYQRLGKVLLSMIIMLAIRLALLQGSLPKFSQQDNPTAFHPSFYVRWVENGENASMMQAKVCTRVVGICSRIANHPQSYVGFSNLKMTKKIWHLRRDSWAGKINQIQFRILLRSAFIIFS